MPRALAGSTRLLAFACLCACGKQGAAGKPVPSASAPLVTTSAPSASAATSAPHSAQSKAECRALAVAGKATVDGVAIVTGMLLDGEHWALLEEGASVDLRHTLTSRELRLIGPALVLPCWHGAEQVLLASGKLSTSTKLGVRPGAEVLIATPAGTIRYGDAAIDAEYGAKGLRMRVKDGDAWVEPESQGVPPFKNPVSNGHQAALPPNRTAASGLAEACKIAAETATESARRVLDGAEKEAPTSLGARAAAHMRARAAARRSCAVAAAATGSLTDPAERQSLWASIAHSDELWQSVPHAISAQKN